MIDVFLDFETYSESQLRGVGAFKYSEHPSTEVLILCYRPRINGKLGKMRTWLPHRDFDLPDDLVEYAENPEVHFHAHNAQFEQCVWENVMVKRWHAPHIDFRRWRCSAAMAAAAGLPRALDKVGRALQLNVQKDKEGTRLINIFCKPRKPTKNNPARRIFPRDMPEDFARFVQYCRTDVNTEIELIDSIPDLDEAEWNVFALDTTMNMRGLPLDMVAVRNGFEMLQKLEAMVLAEVQSITGGIRPTQRDKMLEFLNGLLTDVGEDEIANIQAKTIKDLLELRGEHLSAETVRLLQLRIEGGKASTKKLKKMIDVACKDNRVHGGFLYYGAHTGRWAGKLIQPQNFTRGEYKPYQQDYLFWYILRKELDFLRVMYEWPIDAIAQGMRGFICAPKGRKLVVCDFSAIEARVLAWLAGETKTIELYHQNADLYRRLACKLYKIERPEDVSTPQRKFAKDVFLGCGYQLGGPGFQRNCLQRGIVIELEEAQHAVDTYREDNPNIVKLWRTIENLAVRAVDTGATDTNPVKYRDKLGFYVQDSWFCIRLPSGRVLRYAYPKVEIGERFGRRVKKLTYRSEYKGKWIRENTYGGKLVENIVQAIARDLMVHSCFNAEERGYEVIGTVHDELITEVDEDFGSAHELEEILRIKPEWAKDAPINAEGWEGQRYRK